MRRRGFTLVEVLVALVIATLAIAALARSSHAILRGRRSSEGSSAMMLAAQQALETMLARGPEAFAEGELSEEFGPYLRRRIVRRGPEENLWHLGVTVRDTLGREVRLQTLRYVPWRARP